MFDIILSNFSGTLVFIIVLSILILVHEWGHFITAKKLGIKVEKFALGFGPTIFSKEYQGTTYLINIIPLGGFVKMAGDERSECKGSSEEFFSKPVGHRALVVVNGPVVNFILAYFSFVLVFMIGYPGFSTKIEEVIVGGPAQVAGIKAGDKLVSVDSVKLYGWRHFQRQLTNINKQELDVTVLRDGQEIKTTVKPNVTLKQNEMGVMKNVLDIGIGEYSNAIGGVAKGYPAEKAGLKEGDVIFAVNGKVVYGWKDLQETIASSPKDSIKIAYKRDGKENEVNIVPSVQKRKDANGVTKEVNVIGIGPSQTIDFFKFGPVPAFINAGDELINITVLTYQSLFYMITGKMSAKDSMTGPIGIFYIVKSAFEEGLVHLLFILAVISASLAIFNLLPIIPLDGGHLFLLFLEKVRGKPLSPKVEEWIARVGFSLIILLAVFVFYSDIVKFWLRP